MEKNSEPGKDRVSGILKVSKTGIQFSRLTYSKIPHAIICREQE